MFVFIGPLLPLFGACYPFYHPTRRPLSVPSLFYAPDDNIINLFPQSHSSPPLKLPAILSPFVRPPVVDLAALHLLLVSLRTSDKERNCKLAKTILYLGLSPFLYCSPPHFRSLAWAETKLGWTHFFMSLRFLIFPSLFFVLLWDWRVCSAITLPLLLFTDSWTQPPPFVSPSWAKSSRYSHSSQCLLLRYHQISNRNNLNVHTVGQGVPRKYGTSDYSHVNYFWSHVSYGIGVMRAAIVGRLRGRMYTVIVRNLKKRSQPLNLRVDIA